MRYSWIHAVHMYIIYLKDMDDLIGKLYTIYTSLIFIAITQEARFCNFQWQVKRCIIKNRIYQCSGNWIVNLLSMMRFHIFQLEQYLYTNIYKNYIYIFQENLPTSYLVTVSWHILLPLFTPGEFQKHTTEGTYGHRRFSTTVLSAGCDAP